MFGVIGRFAKAFVVSGKMASLEAELYKKGLLMTAKPMSDGVYEFDAMPHNRFINGEYKSQTEKIFERLGKAKTAAILDVYKGTDAEHFMFLGDAPVHLGMTAEDGAHLWGRKYVTRGDEVRKALAKFERHITDEVTEHDNGSYSFQMQL